MLFSFFSKVSHEYEKTGILIIQKSLSEGENVAGFLLSPCDSIRKCASLDSPTIVLKAVFLCIFAVDMIRKATTEDIPAIRAMADVVFRRTYRDILSPEQLEYMMDMMYSEESLIRQMENDAFYIEDGQGYASLRYDGMMDDGRERFHLEKLYVMPEYQKTGLGRRLFDKIADEARIASGGNPFRLELNVNRANPALGFYEHIGMRKDRSGDFPIGSGYYMNDYIMAIDL